MRAGCNVQDRSSRSVRASAGAKHAATLRRHLGGSDARLLARSVRLRYMRRVPKAVERGVVPLVENVVTRALDYALASCSNPSGQNDPVLFLRGRCLRLPTAV
jgi:hypothetical protein